MHYGPQFVLAIDHKIGIIGIRWTEDKAVYGVDLEVNTKTIS